MMRNYCTLLFTVIMLCAAAGSHAQKIDRKAVVTRHNVIISGTDTLGSLTVGNGGFAFTVDATGLQSFPEYYANGVPLGTQSDWGWHAFPNKNGYKPEEAWKGYDINGRKNSLYAIQPKEKGRAQEASNYYRENPARLQLGNVGFSIRKKDGTPAQPKDLQDIHQELNLWTGEITSNFKIEGIPVNVITVADAHTDAISVKINSPLLKEQRIKIRFRFPYPTNTFLDKGVNYSNNDAHETRIVDSSAGKVTFMRQLDSAGYCLVARWSQQGTVSKKAAHEYELTPAAATDFEVSVLFASTPIKTSPPQSFTEIQKNSIASWQQYWLSGAAIDLAGSTDKRATELERRIVLSQYLERVQGAGANPPQETGLTYNSWYGRPHMEMYWWHTAHFALWGRAEWMERSMGWYFDAYDGAAAIAKRQGFKGVRWQKMTDPWGGESPSSVGSFLIWQQPHVIYLAELLYRNNPSKAVLEKYQKLIFATADFMADFANYDSATHRYNLGKGIIPAQECHKAVDTYNPPYELAYWKWALQVAQKWRIRQGLKPDANWQKLIDRLAPLAQKDGVYKAAENVEDSYSPVSKYTIDHPAVLMAIGTLPANGMVDSAVMLKTYNTIEKAWHWEHTWGWDFPMVGMTATRLHQPEKALDALFKEVTTNTFLVNGHNYQDDRLTIYLPGNGSLLAAVALMCAGWDGNTVKNPGFPTDGTWKVKWEGMKPLP